MELLSSAVSGLLEFMVYSYACSGNVSGEIELAEAGRNPKHISVCNGLGVTVFDLCVGIALARKIGISFAPDSCNSRNTSGEWARRKLHVMVVTLACKT